MFDAILLELLAGDQLDCRPFRYVMSKLQATSNFTKCPLDIPPSSIQFVHSKQTLANQLRC
uniref:AlNc14C237G9420 protein n=1 Tax=Albugo laibachii Nc14 TaxID=890382 RepID=F0WF00_9STRA|nr:AlNc14C79G5198 [Albugo laibachii Nc14]CCA24402.1 AlNc14C237G9420 [Albugo laibachii Nc14]|eukprot:CCA24402.1 AlNc14C237G9420 [Albugo laibachii Nc14]